MAVQFDLPKELGQAEDDDIQRWYLAEHCHDHASSASRVRMYCNYFARQNRLTQDEKQLKEPSKYLALVRTLLAWRGLAQDCSRPDCDRSTNSTAKRICKGL